MLTLVYLCPCLSWAPQYAQWDLDNSPAVDDFSWTEPLVGVSALMLAVVLFLPPCSGGLPVLSVEQCESVHVRFHSAA